MILRYVGKNGETGFRHGELYEVKIYDDGEFIWVMYVALGGTVYKLPYASVKRFAEDWC